MSPSRYSRFPIPFLGIVQGITFFARRPHRRQDVKEIADLKPGMTLEGVITNVTRFGAFVDVGVHQDGLVHISELSNRYKIPSPVGYALA